MDEWVARAHDEGVAANLDAAEAVRDVAKITVPKRTGELAASINASHEGEDALAGPTASARSFNGPYGRAVELGGPRTAHNPSGYMWWYEGGWHHAVANMMPSQPYLKTAVDIAEGTGHLDRLYRDHWLRAQQGL